MGTSAGKASRIGMLELLRSGKSKPTKAFVLGNSGVPAVYALQSSYVQSRSAVSKAHLFALVLALVAALALNFSTVSMARADSDADGKVMSFVCEDLPPDAAVTVEAYNDDDLNLGIADAFKEELVKRDYRVGQGQQFRVMMDSRIDLDRIDRRDPSLGSLTGNRRGVQLNLNIWSNRDDSLLTGRRKDPTREPPRLIVTATLRDRETDKVFWRGEASDALGNNRPLKVGKALMPALAEAFGCSLDPSLPPSSTE